MDLAELGVFLKSRRDRVSPAGAGVPAGPRRRVPGLRRDEVAGLANASVDYYAQLEQGGAQPSEQMLGALATALKLTKDERDHMFHLAGRVIPAQPGGTGVEAGLADLLDRLGGVPAQIVTDFWTVLARNHLATVLLGPADGLSATGDSFLVRWFTDHVARAAYPTDDHDGHSERLVSELRAAVARRDPADPDAAHLLDTLQQRSPEFAGLWQRRDVAVRHHETKRLLHPNVGAVEVECLSMFSADGRQRLVWFAPAPGTRAVEQLEMLSVGGAVVPDGLDQQAPHVGVAGLCDGALGAGLSGRGSLGTRPR